MSSDSKRKLILALRRRVKVQCQFDVEPLGDGKENHTCRNCGTIEIVELIDNSSSVLHTISKYRAKDGVSGICKTCSKQVADERYPLPKKTK